jgi:TATA-binding protein-associated factor Taf7
VVEKLTEENKVDEVKDDDEQEEEESSSSDDEEDENVDDDEVMFCVLLTLKVSPPLHEHVHVYLKHGLGPLLQKMAI